MLVSIVSIENFFVKIFDYRRQYKLKKIIVLKDVFMLTIQDQTGTFSELRN